MGGYCTPHGPCPPMIFSTRGSLWVKNRELPENHHVHSARFSIFKGQKHPKNFELFFLILEQTFGPKKRSYWCNEAFCKKNAGLKLKLRVSTLSSIRSKCDYFFKKGAFGGPLILKGAISWFDNMIIATLKSRRGPNFSSPNCINLGLK